LGGGREKQKLTSRTARQQIQVPTTLLGHHSTLLSFEPMTFSLWCLRLTLVPLDFTNLPNVFPSGVVFSGSLPARRRVRRRPRRTMAPKIRYDAEDA